ncbi:MAG TPA: glycosyltransferase, partial [Terriglobia bacterium]|nr:glycosyltransferase [Terriglobia bacterium]
MTICDLALYSPETSSGVRTYIENRIRYIRSRSDVEKHVVIVPGTEDQVVVQHRTKLITVRGIPSFYPGVSLAINIGRIAEIVEREAPDVIEVNCQYTLPWVAFLATRRRRIPVVGVYHTDVPACARHMVERAGLPLSNLVEKIVDAYVGLVYRHFTLTIVLNDGVIRRLNRLGVDRIQRLPCGVDIEIFNPERIDLDFRKRLSIRSDQKILLYVGRLSAEKEIDLLLESHSKLPPGEFVLLIAGDGPDKEAIERYADSHISVRYLGHFDSPSELASVYASS